MDTRIEIITNNISYMFVFKTVVYMHCIQTCIASSIVNIFIESPCIQCCVYLHSASAQGKLVSKASGSPVPECNYS